MMHLRDFINEQDKDGFKNRNKPGRDLYSFEATQSTQEIKERTTKAGPKDVNIVVLLNDYVFGYLPML